MLFSIYSYFHSSNSAIDLDVVLASSNYTLISKQISKLGRIVKINLGITTSVDIPNETVLFKLRLAGKDVVFKQSDFLTSYVNSVPSGLVGRRSEDAYFVNSGNSIPKGSSVRIVGVAIIM